MFRLSLAAMTANTLKDEFWTLDIVLGYRTDIQRSGNCLNVSPTVFHNFVMLHTFLENVHLVPGVSDHDRHSISGDLGWSSIEMISYC